MDQEPVLEVSGVWKKYCRHLKRAMWYGLREIGRQLWVRADRTVETRPKLRPGEFFAVRDANFRLRRGECVGMIGPNGAGKSTMLKMINGLIRPDAGTIRIRGRIGALIELGTGFNPVLSGRENIFINGAVLGLGRREVAEKFDQIVDFSGLQAVINDPIKTYSSGMRVRLGFSVAAHLNPDLLIMDEVLAVGDVAFRMKCFRHFQTLAGNGTAIILVTHAVGMLPRVADRTIVFDQGGICFDGPVQEGITVYEKNLSENPSAQPPGPQADGLSGGSRAVISSVAVLDGSGAPASDFRTGDRLKLRIEVRCSRPLPAARVIVAIASPRFEELGSTSSWQAGRETHLVPGEHVFELELESLPLLVGSYYFNISLYGREITDFEQRRSGVGVFRIVGPDVDVNGYGLYGTLAFAHRWTSRGPAG